MLSVLGRRLATCDGVSRRAVLQAGALSLFGGLNLPQALAARDQQGRQGPQHVKSVVLFNLFGGPSHIDTFDLKPDAPTEVRGEFNPIATSLSGVQICEHLPLTARWMDRLTLIRTLSHGYNSHNPYALMTVIVRPFPWESGSIPELVTALEAAFVGYLIIKGGKNTLGRVRRDRPIAIYATVATLVFVELFSHFNNFGILARQRTQIAPFLYLLLALPPTKSKADPDTNAPKFGNDLAAETRR